MRRIALLLLLVAQQAFAVSPEFGIGMTRFGKQVDGVWYQQPYPHTLDLRSTSWKVGLTGKHGWRWHAGYEHLGKYDSYALAKGSDHAYLHGRQYPLSTWIGNGEAGGLYVSAGPEYKSGSYTLHPTIGAYWYRASWTMHIPNWVGCAWHDEHNCPLLPPRPLTVHGLNKTYLGGMLGLSLARENVSLDLTARQIQTHGDPYPPIIKGVTWNASMTIRIE